jgi:peptidoglycan/xylan/chitin deacetylase (PgdA/CDA1 family)
MRPKRDPVPRARDSWVWLGGLALLGILGGGVTAAAVLLWENIDIRQLIPQLAAAAAPIPLPEPTAPASRDGRAFDAVVFSSPRNQAFFPDPTYYRAALDAWSELVRDTGGRVREVADAEGLRGLDEEDLLVLVEAPCLSTAEVEAVHAHLQAGGGVVSNWAVGARDADCEWTGWQTVADLTGAEDVREIPPREGLYLTVPGSVALSPGFDPGTRIELRPDPSLALRLSGPRVYWSDWALNPVPDESGGGADVAAVATYSAQGGRLSWFGLRVGQGATPVDSTRLSRLVQNGVAWAASVPTTAPAAWPGARRAAIVFALDVEDEAQNALATTTLLRERNIPGTFFVVSQLVIEDDELARALREAGEVGSQTSDHTPLVRLTTQDQRVRLRRSWADIEAWTGVAPLGIHPPEETFDANTLDAWQRVGGTYLLAGNESRSASPEIHRVGETTMVLLPRILKDDYNIIVQDRVLRGASLGQALLADQRKMRAIGGVAVVVGHTQIIREGPRIEALAAVADSALAQGDWWITRGADVAAWWTARVATTVEFEALSPTAVPGQAPVADIVVTAPLDRSVEDLWIDIVVPSAPEGMVPLVAGRSVDFESTDWGMRVPVGNLSAGELRRITFLVLEDEEATAPAAR